VNAPPEECLTGLTSKPRVKKILVYDLESKDGPTQKPGFTRVFMGGVYDGTRFCLFRNLPGVKRKKQNWPTWAIDDGGCLDGMMRYVLRKQYRGHAIYAHNGGNFDHLHLLPWLTKRIAEFSYRIVPMQSSIQVLKVTERSTGYAWTFLDSVRLFPMTLDQAAKSFGYEGKLRHDLNLHEGDPSWEPYLERDCKALYQCLSEFQELILHKLGGELGITAPSTAMKLYRRSYMGRGKAPAMIPQHRHHKGCTGVIADPENAARLLPCEGCLHAWIRRGYYGGNVQVFQADAYQDALGNHVRGAKNVSYYDINSSYPRAMLDPMPGGVMKQYGPKKGPEDFARLEQQAVGFVECEVSIPRSCYLPPLPYRAPKTGKLIFPTGTFSGVWAWSELKLLSDPLVGGRITKVVRSVWYEKKTLFFDFVKELYNYRDKDSPDYDSGLALISKLMMVSLYGKFGMNEERKEIYVLRKDEKPPEGASFPRFEDGQEDVLSRVCFVTKRVAPPYIAPQISAQITALGRVRLWESMATVLRMGGILYYGDTDSLLTNLASLPTSHELGALKNEYPGKTIDVELVGAKMYLLRAGDFFAGEHKPICHNAACDEEGCLRCLSCPGCVSVKLRMKGFPKDVRTEENLRKLQAGETVYFERLEKLGAMAEKGFLKPPAMRRVSKRHVTAYDKRILHEDGTTSPLHILEEKMLNGVSTVKKDGLSMNMH
jgi:hypothetical protein